MLTINNLVGFGAGHRQKTLTWQDSDFTLADGTSINFASKAIGAAATDRYVIVGVRGAGSGIGAISGGSVGGIAASVVASVLQGTCAVGLLIAGPIPTGTTATINVTFAATSLRTGITWWSVTGIESASAFHSQTSTASPGAVTLNVQQDGFAVGMIGQNNTAAYGWTNLTERNDTNDGDGATFSGADSNGLTGGGTLAVSCTYSVADTNRALVAASW